MFRQNLLRRDCEGAVTNLLLDLASKMFLRALVNIQGLGYCLLFLMAVSDEELRPMVLSQLNIPVRIGEPELPPPRQLSSDRLWEICQANLPPADSIAFPNIFISRSAPHLGP